MLKWLQSGVYHTANVNDIITDNPLATLNFKDDDPAKKQSAGNSKSGPAGAILAFRGMQANNHKEIYSVSR